MVWLADPTPPYFVEEHEESVMYLGPENDNESPPVDDAADLEEAQEDAAEKREEEGGYQ
jgi:hypothetical protein